MSCICNSLLVYTTAAGVDPCGLVTEDHVTCPGTCPALEANIVSAQLLGPAYATACLSVLLQHALFPLIWLLTIRPPALALAFAAGLLCIRAQGWRTSPEHH
jgi:hypothetical protein